MTSRTHGEVGIWADTESRSVQQRDITENCKTSPRRTERRENRVSLTSAMPSVAFFVSLLIIGCLGSPQPLGAVTAPAAPRGVSSTPVDGRLPNDAIMSGVVEWAKVRSYISIYSGPTFIGYVKKVDVAHQHPIIEAGPLVKPIHLPGPTLCSFDGGGIDVYSRSHAVIGHIMSGVGFVRLNAVGACPSR